MIVYLAGIWPWRENGIYDEELKKRESDGLINAAILESFCYVDDWSKWAIPRLSNYMLDSGAFTFMRNSHSAPDWDEYLDSYIDFINKNDVKLFFELDIDSVVGYDCVLRFRKRLEEGTGKKSIPVWHFPRGKDEFLRMCEEYEYVAIGGLVPGNKEYSSKYWKYFPWYIKTAHEHNARIHALGFTNLNALKKYHFDSVDSSSWTAGSRFGTVYKFDGQTIRAYQKKQGQRVEAIRELAVSNFGEWLKFQQYAKLHL